MNSDKTRLLKILTEFHDIHPGQIYLFQDIHGQVGNSFWNFRTSWMLELVATD